MDGPGPLCWLWSVWSPLHFVIFSHIKWPRLSPRHPPCLSLCHHRQRRKQNPHKGRVCVCNQNKFLPKRDLTERVAPMFIDWVASDPNDHDWIFCPKLRGGNYAPGHETQFNCSLCSVVQMSAVAAGNQSSPSWINNESLCTNIWNNKQMRRCRDGRYWGRVLGRE